MFRAEVFTRMAIARLAKAEKKIKVAGEATVGDLVNVGKETARILVPKGKKGWLYKSIQGRVIKGKTPRGIIFLSPQYLPNDGEHRRKYTGQNWKYVRFNIAKWMHTSQRALSHFNKSSKELRFMYTTRAELEKRKGGIAGDRF